MVPVVPEVPVLQREHQERMEWPVIRLVASPMFRLAAARVLVARGPGPTREVQAQALLPWALTCFQVQSRTTVRQVAEPEHWVRVLLEQRVRLWAVCACHALVAQRAPTWQSSQARRLPGVACLSVLDEKLLVAKEMAALSVVDVVELAMTALQYPALPQHQALRLGVRPLVESSVDWSPGGPRLGHLWGCLSRRCLHHPLRLEPVRLARWSWE